MNPRGVASPIRITVLRMPYGFRYFASDPGLMPFHEAARREFDQLSEDARDELRKVVGQHWSLNVNLAVRKLWHAATVLGFKPDTLDPQHVAMLAATYLSREPDDVFAELTKATEKDPMDTSGEQQ